MDSENKVICKLCGQETKEHFRALVLGKYSEPFRYCIECDFVFAANPHWLSESYSDSIVAADTDIALRNIRIAIRLVVLLFFGMNGRGDDRYVDVAGGYGLLTRLMRDFGFDYYWADPFTKNIFARGFEYEPSVGHCGLITAIEVLEHVEQPAEFIQQSLDKYNTDTIVFSTELFPNGKPPQVQDWYYYFPEIGQHISFFSFNGLNKLAQRMNMKFISLGRIHIFTRKKISNFGMALAKHNLLMLPAAMYAMKKLKSRRDMDQQLLLNQLRSTLYK